MNAAVDGYPPPMSVIGRGSKHEYLRNHATAIARAALRIDIHIRRTPTIDTDLDQRLMLKCELLQHSGSFKARGAFNAVLALLERDPDIRGVIAFSAGNHAQGLALAGRTLGIKTLIVIPAAASRLKIDATRSLGAEVVTEGVTLENRVQVLDQLKADRGFTEVHPFDDWDVIHGQATAALELIQTVHDLGSILVPIGGGGLLAGTALAAKSHRPKIRVIGVEPASADDCERSFRMSALVVKESGPSLADGARVNQIGSRPYEVIVDRRLVDEVATVSESEIRAATLALWSRSKVFVEPTAALPVAAFLAGRIQLPPGRVGVILSGGNVDAEVVRRLLRRQR